ncbi:hypothetical protein TNCV_707391 [Trichonephila clavipes]|nr:hypothetical protein TNCV_707391 [Trichonephila clavipes]
MAMVVEKSRSRSLVPLKTLRVQYLIYDKFVEAQTPPIGLVRKFGERSARVQASSRHLIVAQNYEVCDESVRNLSTNLLRCLFGKYKFAFISNQLHKDERDI